MKINNGEEVKIYKVCRTMGNDVFGECARIHCEEIKGGFLPSLGVRFLSGMYDFIANNPKTFLYVAIDGAQVIGFICGSVNNGSILKQFVFAKGLSLAPILLSKLIRPRILRKVWETLRYTSGSHNLDLPMSEVLNFCVSSSQQGKGVGGKLFSELCKEFKNRDVRAIRIITGSEQKSAQGFYDKLGAKKVGELEVHAGVSSIAYMYDLDDSLE
jgi:ribosomal protein S18 acetylase RimI-like enzyme